MNKINVWEEYEIEKGRISDLNLTIEEYQRRIAEIIDILKL